MSESQTDVLVVGAGPVGLMLAGELRLGGARVVVAERLPAPTTQSRASTLHARTMELLDQRGLIAELGEVARDDTGHFGGIPLPLGVQPSRYAGLWKVPQTRIEEILGVWATGLGAEVRRGCELTALDQDGAAVTAVLRDQDGSTARLRARYAVGCDGEKSTVRGLAGFEFVGTAAGRELLRADVAGIDVPNRRFQRLPRGLAIAARRPDGVTRVMVHEFGRPAAARRAEPDFDEVTATWARVTGEDISRGTPVWINSFGDASHQVTRYRRGRVLLAGDAAHAQMPVGGQALNLGLQDAVNLGWKLAATVRGRAPAGLLDTYHEERHLVGSQVLSDIAAQATLLLGGPEVEPIRSVMSGLLELEAVRDRLGSGISGVGIRYPMEDAGHPLLGARLPHAELITEAGASTTGALLRSGRGLLLELEPRSSDREDLRTVARGWADRVCAVTARPRPGDRAVATRALLARPDGHVVWADGGERQLRGALTRWFGHPLPT
ncbi:FAD-dependent monooxygenase [Streptomyces beihaiensis]|uniref:FAD-dependent monooxygenase n=1 Tax=Streptomyces beihaiensis TaxID=2984495 RepID=A0ABT3TYL9_9ACTN|nr:FAD-dependent monooxygenase [Streptomyces beihaiensis]MCX3062147.1 FAD-dependent monooxygenase [Streptomyces beihaiensis]